MENQTIWNMRKWMWFLAICLSFSLQHIFAEPTPAYSLSTCQSNGHVPPVVFTFNCVNGQPGDTICVPVTVSNFNQIVIAQFEIYWNSDVLDYIEIKNPGIAQINLNGDFNLSGPNALKFIPLNFDLFNGESLPDGSTIFEVCFRIIGTPGSTSNVGISPFFDFEVADINSVVPSDSIGCNMTVSNAVTLVGFVTSCGPGTVGDDGTIDVTVYGGTSPYNITWVETTSGLTGGPVAVPSEGVNMSINAPAGNYDLTITDTNGNMVTYNTDVDTLGLSVFTRLKDPTCYKFKNGTMWIKPLGGSEPYSYIWKNLSNPNLAGSGFIRHLGDSSLVTSLPDGMYTILVKDDNGCKAEVTVQLLDKPFVFTINSLQDATCNGSKTGFINFSISGGTPDVDSNYTITIKPGFTVVGPGATIGLLNPGVYCITVQDQVSQCDTVYCFTIGAQNIISANVTPTDAPCAGTNDGKVSISGLTNGVPGLLYSYTIYHNGMQQTSAMNITGVFNYSPLPPGTYMIIVEEGACKSDSIPFTIGEPLPMIVTLQGTKLDNCLPTGSGAAWFQITNGMGPYILNAGSGVQDGDTLKKLNAGSYILTVTDSKGCVAHLPFKIHDYSENEQADITFQIDGTPCDGGTVTVFYQGGTPPPGSILWDNMSTAQTIPITQTDTLGVHILLGNPIFCLLFDTVIVDCVKKLHLDITVLQPQCGDEAVGGPYTGTVIVDTTNAVAPVTWIWSIPDTTTTGIYAGLSPGKYYVTVTDAIDSVAVDSFEIIAPPALHLTFGIPDSTSCPETCDGAVMVTPEDGDISMNYFLYWNTTTAHADTNFFFQVQNLCQGLTGFTVSQDGVCFYTDTVEIFSPAPIDISLTLSTPVTCYGGDDGSLEVTASGGTPLYSYDWEGGSMLPVSTDLSAGTYIVTVTDMYNCIQVDSFVVDQPDTLIAQIDVSGTFNLSCGSSSDGIIVLDVSGGNDGGYTFLWNPDVSSIYQAVNLVAGKYLITATDPKGCTDTTSYLLTSPPPIMTTWPSVVPPACFGDETLLQINQVTGGSGNYSFNINGGQLMNIGDPVMIPSGIYIVSVFDDRGCSEDTTYTIIEPNPILVSIGPDNPIVNIGDSLFIVGHVDQSDNAIAMMAWSSTEPVSCPLCEGTYVFNVLPTIYTWTVTDVNGCQGSESITVGVDYNRDVFIPNVFSPNNDGRNEDFRIYTGPGVVSINYLHIYDRWGNLVHSENKMLPSPTGSGNWDGTFDGQPLSPGVYVYVAEIEFIDNHTKLIYRGDITLIK